MRRGKRVVFLAAPLYNPESQLAAQATSTGLLAGLWSSESRPRATASGVLRPHRRWIRRSVPDRCGKDVQPQRLQAHPADPGADRVLP